MGVYIEQAIRENFDGMHLNPAAVRSVLEQYGTERTAYVLANTIQQKSWDGRFSGSNKEWAQSVAVGEDTNTAGEDRRRAFVVDSHPAVLDGFTDLFRKELRDRGLLQIPSDRMNGGKGIGFNLDDGSDYAGSYPLVQGGKVATDMIDLVEHYKNSPLVQQAVEEAKRYYPDMRETEYQPREAQETAPVVEQKNVEEATITDDKRAPEPAEKRSETVEKGTEGKSASRKESVLKALRERQAQIKEREKTLPQKQHDRNKEEHAL